MKLIKNTTPYIGKLSLKFEKEPYYTSGGSILNAVHLDLGFTKLVSRLQTDRSVDPIKRALIHEFTDGCIGTYEKWIVKGVNGTFESFTKPKNEKDIVYHMVLENMFLTNRGEFIGDAETGWWYFQNGMSVCEDYPHGVAVCWNTPKGEKTIEHGQDGIKGYCGYTHRGACIFTIGDRLFDESYEPKKEDYEEWEWAGWQQEYNDAIAKSEKEIKNDGIGRFSPWTDEIKNDGIGRFIPFRQRGDKVIETLEEAKQAAINLSKYLS